MDDRSQSGLMIMLVGLRRKEREKEEVLRPSVASY
jgi:hypothetical protein